LTYLNLVRLSLIFTFAFSFAAVKSRCIQQIVRASPSASPSPLCVSLLFPYTLSLCGGVRVSRVCFWRKTCVCVCVQQVFTVNWVCSGFYHRWSHFFYTSFRGTLFVHTSHHTLGPSPSILVLSGLSRVFLSFARFIRAPWPCPSACAFALALMLTQRQRRCSDSNCVKIFSLPQQQSQPHYTEQKSFGYSIKRGRWKRSASS